MLMQGPSAHTADPAKAVQIKTTLADVIQFSGCRDDQTSADAKINNEATGSAEASLFFLSTLT